MKRYIALISISLVGLVWPKPEVYAQGVAPGSFGYYNEALLFSQTSPGGSARVLGMGGAQVSLGGDISSVLSNPAGLGVYRRSEASLSPNLNFSNSEAVFFNQTTTNSNVNFSIPNLGVVLHSESSREGPFKGGAFGISLTKINDFNNRFTYAGENFDNSIIDFFLEDASGLTPGQLGGLTGVAFDHYLINPDNPEQTEYFSDVAGFPIQEETVETSGAQYQWSFGYGANFNDRFYIGANVGISTINYSEVKTFREYDFFDPANPNDISILNEIDLRETLNITGTGFNASIGMIYRPADFIRIGANISSPTYYRLDEESFFDFTTDYNNYLFVPDDTLLNTITTNGDFVLSRYDVNTPMRISTGVAFFLGKSGFITLDADFLDYSSISLQSNDFSTIADNQTIDNLYKDVVNLRAGAEFRAKNLRFRVGYARQGDALNLDDDFDRSINIFSAGAGLRYKSYFVDLAIQHTRRDQSYSPYTTFNTPAPVALVESGNTNATISVGWFF